MPGLTLPRSSSSSPANRSCRGGAGLSGPGDRAGWASARLRAVPEPVPWGVLSWCQKVIPETTEEFYLLLHLLQVRKRVRQVTADQPVEGVTLEDTFWF